MLIIPLMYLTGIVAWIFITYVFEITNKCNSLSQIISCLLCLIIIPILSILYKLLISLAFAITYLIVKLLKGL